MTALPAAVAGNYFGYIEFAPYATWILIAWIAVFLGTVATMFRIRRLAMEASEPGLFAPVFNRMCTQLDTVPRSAAASCVLHVVAVRLPSLLTGAVLPATVFFAHVRTHTHHTHTHAHRRTSAVSSRATLQSARSDTVSLIASTSSRFSSTTSRSFRSCLTRP